MKPGEVFLYNSQSEHGGEKGSLKLSNPIEYQEWFLHIANNLDLNNCETLQKLVILAKKHRDVMFENDSIKKYKPISVLITNLFAQYTSDYLESPEIKSNMGLRQYLFDRLDEDYSKVSHVYNPRCNEEEYTDRWHCYDGNIRKRSFQDWSKEYIEKNL